MLCFSVQLRGVDFLNWKVYFPVVISIMFKYLHNEKGFTSRKRKLKVLHDPKQESYLMSLKDVDSLCRSIFAQFMTMWEKHILARALGIRKENWG